MGTGGPRHSGRAVFSSAGRAHRAVECSVGLYVHMLAIPAISMEEPPAHRMELFAFRMLQGSMNLDAFHEMQRILLQCLPQLTKARKRRCVEFANKPKGGASFSLHWGSFLMGGIPGLTRNSKDFPWMTRLLVALIRGHRSQHVFSSLGLHLNTYMAPHLDKHNHPALPSFIIPCGRWQGGGLWVCDQSLPKQSSNGDMMGRVYTLGPVQVTLAACHHGAAGAAYGIGRLRQQQHSYTE